LPLLRKEIASLYQNVRVEDILVVAPQEGILIAMLSLLEACIAEILCFSFSPFSLLAW
jgi:hypothetical protein